MTQPSHPTFTLASLPQPPSNPETPDMPGTPTSATTSLSALSTTAIKDGHRGHAPSATLQRGHQHQGSTNSLDAERADRISRLAGLSTVSTLRPPHPNHGSQSGGQQNASPSGLPSGQQPPGLSPAYFDAAGQPIAATKMSTVGTASATESVGGRTVEADRDMDLLSMDTNYRETETDDASGYLANRENDIDPMDEDLASRSVGGFEDRMSDDGTASLVGFGEGASSTVSGPIYQRRPLPGGGPWGVERSSSGVSDVAMAGAGAGAGTRRDTVRAAGDNEGGGLDSPAASIAAPTELRDTRSATGEPLQRKPGAKGLGAESVPQSARSLRSDKKI